MRAPRAPRGSVHSSEGRTTNDYRKGGKYAKPHQFIGMTDNPCAGGRRAPIRVARARKPPTIRVSSTVVSCAWAKAPHAVGRARIPSARFECVRPARRPSESPLAVHGSIGLGPVGRMGRWRQVCFQPVPARAATRHTLYNCRCRNLLGVSLYLSGNSHPSIRSIPGPCR